jgi:hypothetical protein
MKVYLNWHGMLGNLKQRHHFETSGIVRMILKRVLMKYGGRSRTRLMWLRIRTEWRAPVNTVTKLRGSVTWVISRLVHKLLASEEGLCSTHLVPTRKSYVFCQQCTVLTRGRIRKRIHVHPKQVPHIPALVQEYRYASLHDGETFWEMRRLTISSLCERLLK